MTLSIEQVAKARATAQEKLDEAKSAYEDEAAKLEAQIRKLDDWLWTNGSHTANSVTEEYVALRDSRAVLKKEYDTRDQQIKDAMQVREIWLQQAMDAIDAKSLRTDHGTAYKTIKTRSNCADWPAFWDYIAENKRFDLLEKRVSQKPISDMLEEDGSLKEGEELPPGINLFRESTITVRRS